MDSEKITYIKDYSANFSIIILSESQLTGETKRKETKGVVRETIANTDVPKSAVLLGWLLDAGLKSKLIPVEPLGEILTAKISMFRAWCLKWFWTPFFSNRIMFL